MSTFDEAGRPVEPRVDPPSDGDTERHAIMHKFARQDRFRAVFIDSAHGTRVQDANGRSYLDAFSQSWYAVVGHGRQSIADAIAEQAHELASVHAGRFSTAPRRALARRLLDHLPVSFRRVAFGANGSDSIEIALKAARLATGRQGVVSFSGSYHGASMAAMSVTGLAYCRRGFGEPVPGTTFVPYPNCYRCPLRLSYPSCDVACAGLVEQAIQTQGAETVAAVIGEPVQGVGGVVVPPEPYWRRVREIADRYDVWLIFDEVVTAFGRCGSWFAFEQFDTVPDIVTLGKGLTSGYQPLSAAVFNERVDAMLASLPFFHGMTFQGHAVACAAALANIDVLTDDMLVERSADLGAKLRRRLLELGDRHRCVGDVRGLGAMWAVELVQDPKERAPFVPGRPFLDANGQPVDAGTWVSEELLRRHRVHAGSAEHTVILAPPLTYSDVDIDETIDALSSVLGEVDRHCIATNATA